MDERERVKECEWLARVLAEANRQYLESCGAHERLEEEALETQRELWENVGPLGAGGGLEQIADFMGYIGVMKRQKQDHAFFTAQKVKYERMLLSPYFGRVDFKKRGEDEAKPAYIGLANLIDADYRALVCDWRAPVASLFYDYETGDAAYDCPRGRIEGALTLKRQYRIRGGKLEYMFDSSLKIDDEILQQVLSGSAGDRMKTIVTSIQREQNRAIREERMKNLVVRGPAGSGKTSIALHRAAYLLYRYRDTLSARDILIFSPNRVFADYISDVLPELGEENIAQDTFSERMRAALPKGFRAETYADMMEFLLNSGEHPSHRVRAQGMRLKASPGFLARLEEYAAALARERRDFTDIAHADGVLVPAQELYSLYAEEYRAYPLKKRLEKLRGRCLFLLDNWEKTRAHALAADKRSECYNRKKMAAAAAKRESALVRAQIDGMTAFDPAALYRDFIARLAREEAGNGPESAQILTHTLENIDAAQLSYEDQAPLLYLAALLGNEAKNAPAKFVLVDEAQDYTLLQLKLLRLWFSGAGVALLGDPEQAINPYMNLGDFEALGSVLPPGETLTVSLEKSYRSTAEIMEFARALLPEAPRGELVERHGEAVETLVFPDEAALARRVAADAEAYLARGYRSVAVVARTKQEAGELCRALRNKIKIGEILEGDEEFASGAVVIPAYLAKGLEFDVVLVCDAPNGGFRREQERALYYTACTRALHVLRVYRAGETPP